MLLAKGAIAHPGVAVCVVGVVVVAGITWYFYQHKVHTHYTTLTPTLTRTLMTVLVASTRIAQHSTAQL